MKERDIVDENLRLMQNSEGNGMESILQMESMGGSTYGSDPCKAVNFFYESNNGRLSFFWTGSFPSEKLRQDLDRGLFELVYHQSNGKEEIIGTLLNSPSEEAKSVIENSVTAYNYLPFYEPKKSFLVRIREIK